MLLEAFLHLVKHRFYTVIPWTSVIFLLFGVQIFSTLSKILQRKAAMALKSSNDEFFANASEEAVYILQQVRTTDNFKYRTGAKYSLHSIIN